MAADTSNRQYLAQIGPELIEIPAEEAELHGKGAAFSTSGPVRHYIVRETRDDTRYEGYGKSWDEATKDLEGQLPPTKGKKK